MQDNRLQWILKMVLCGVEKEECTNIILFILHLIQTEKTTTHVKLRFKLNP